MYRRILLCYDGTKEGRNALKEGAEVALAMQAETHLLAILRDMVPQAVPEAVTSALFQGEEDAAREILKEGVDWLQARGLSAQGHIVFGDPIAHIRAFAQELGVGLIVLGHRPRSALARWWSDAEDATLLESAPCSVLVACGGPEA